jgi:subtilisin family serine protease
MCVPGKMKMRKVIIILTMILVISVFANAESYIVEFKEQTSLEKYNELNALNQRNINKYNSMFFLNPVKWYYGWFVIKNDKQIQKEVEEYNLGLDKRVNGYIIDIKEEYSLDDSAIGTKFTKGFPGVVIYTDAQTSDRIKSKPYVRSINPNLALKMMMNETVTLMNIDLAWKIKDSMGTNLSGLGVRVAIIDTGFDLTRSSFSSVNIVEKRCFCSQDNIGCCPDGSTEMRGDEALADSNGHGTFVLGILASNNQNYRGISPKSEYMLVKIASQTETATTEDFLKALQFIIDPNNDGNFNDRADVLSLSLGAIAKELYDKVVLQYKDFGLTEEEIRQAVMDYFEPLNRMLIQSSKLGVTVVAAAGNNPKEGYVTAFAMIEEPIIVGALTKENQLARYSSWGPAFNGLDAPDVLATGGCTFNCLDFSYYGSLDTDGKIAYLKDNAKKGIRSVKSSSVVCMVKTQTGECLDNGIMFGRESEEIYATENNNFVSLEGTSLSSAVVSGISSLMLQKHPDWTPAQVQIAFKSTATTLGLDKYRQGAGKVNILGAMNYDFTCYNVDFNTDAKNCGRCGNACTGTYKCIQGVCEFCGDHVCSGGENAQTCNQDCNCIPSCTNKECGTDGCGGSCGTCTDEKSCYEGKCMFVLTGIRVNCSSGVCANFTLGTIPSACSGQYQQVVKAYKINYSDKGGELVYTLNSGTFTLQAG